MDEEGMSVERMIARIEKWVLEVREGMTQSATQEDLEIEKVWDDVRGGMMNVGDVRKARCEEIEYMKSRGIWREVDVEECWKRTGKAPIGVRWVDTNKGSEERPEVRSRLVARDFRTKAKREEEALFAATPPIEAGRMVLSKAATWKRNGNGKRGLRKIIFIDAKKAHLNPECHEEVYVELPEEAGARAGKCGKLLRWLYGCRRAAQAWETFYSEKLQGAGFVRGRACGVVFRHPERDVSVMCHGDDFMATGDGGDLRWLASLMATWFEIKVRAVMGPEEGDDKEVVILGRCVRWRDWGIEFEADPRHRRIVMEHFGLGEDSASGRVNGDRERREEAEDEEEMDRAEATVFRGLAARLNYLSQDAPDVQFAAKETAREMAKPTRGAWRRLKKLARYLVSRVSVVWTYRWQEEGQRMRVKTDSDWGGSRWDRKSTSGGLLALGCHCLKTWSSTQGAVALSSAEAEFYAMVDGVLRAKWAVTVAEELGCGVDGGSWS